jgi:hypothetical protein
MANRYCIYRHIKPNGEVFYIGIGNIKRPYERRHRNDIWSKTIKKYPDYLVEILKKDMELEDAKELEIILIDYYGRKTSRTGTLCNITLGGEGSFGLKHSDKSKKKMSKNKLGKPSWNKGIKHSEYHKENLKKNSGMAKKVICTETGKIWDSIADCANENGFVMITLSQYLRGQTINKTTFKFLTNG